MYSFRAAIQAVRRDPVAQIERAAFAALLVLAASFGVEALRFPIVISGETYTNVQLLQFVVIGLWFVHRILTFQKPESWRELPVGLTIAIGLWLAALWLSTFQAPDFRNQVFTFDSHIVLGALLAWVAYDLTRTSERWLWLIRSFAVGGIIVYALGLAEVMKISPLSQWLIDLRGVSIYAGELLRLSSTLPYPNIAAIVIELTLFPLLAWIIATQRLWLRLSLAIGLAAGLAALVLTYSRGGLIAFCITLLVIGALAVYYRKRQGQRWAIILGGSAVISGLTIIAVFLALTNPIAVLRFVTEDDQSWYQVAFSVSAQVSARPGETITIPVTVTNTGQLPWPAGGDQAVHLSYHFLWTDPDMTQGLQYEGLRTALPADVLPGQSATLMALVSTPSVSGGYLIRWDMVQESVTWFSVHGAPTADTRLTLDGEPASSAIPFEASPFVDVPPLRHSPGRLTLWRIALQIFQSHPLLGIGPDNFRRTYGAYLGMPGSGTEIHANNVYIEWLADTGLVGLLAFLFMSMILARLAWHVLKQQLHGPLWLWQIALMGSLLAWYIHGVVDYFYEFTPTNVAFWLLVGLAVSGQFQSRDQIM